MKRMLSLALALVLVLGLMPFALADGTATCEHNNWDAGTVTTPATCGTAGEKTYHCKETVEGVLCQGVKTETIAPGVSVGAACTDADNNGICDVCGATLQTTTTTFTLSVSNMSLEVKKGATKQISASVSKEPADSTETAPAISYESRDTTIATVSESGLVTGVKAGTTTITVSAEGCTSVPVSVTVYDDAYISWTGTSARIGYSITVAPTLYVNGSAIDNATFSFKVGGQSIGNGKTASFSKTTAGVYSVTIEPLAYSIDGVSGDITRISSLTVNVSFYDTKEYEATMKTGKSSFMFDDIGIFSTVSVDGVSKSYASTYSVSNMLASSSCSYVTLEQLDSSSKVAQITYVDSTLSSLKFSAIGENKYMMAQVDGLKVSCLKDGEFTLLYNIYNSESLILSSGWITLNIKSGDGDIIYNTTLNKSFALDAADFTKLWKNADVTGSISYVVFGGQPTYGYLYVDDSLKNTVSSTQKFYFSGTSNNLLSDVTYVPYSSLKSAYEDEVTFTIYGANATQTISGVITIKVGANVSFTDVKTSDWFYDSVIWAVNEGITKGATSTTFEPNSNCDRSQVVTFLWRAAGEPKPTTSYMPFTDVNKDDFYYDAVLWAVENGITEGTSKTTFSPNMTVTRGQVVTFLWRAMGEKTVSSVNPFTDIKSSEYYYDAVLWAVKNEITEGMGNGKFLPDTGCTRAQIVTFLYRAYN